MRALQHLGTKDFRLDVLSSDIVQYIINGELALCIKSVPLNHFWIEYRKAMVLLGNTPIDSPVILHERFRSSRSHIAVSLTGDLPMVCGPIRFALHTN